MQAELLVPDMKNVHRKPSLAEVGKNSKDLVTLRVDFEPHQTVFLRNVAHPTIFGVSFLELSLLYI